MMYTANGIPINSKKMINYHGHYTEKIHMGLWLVRNINVNINVLYNVFIISIIVFIDQEANDAQKSDDSYTYAKMILRDKRRWAAADTDSDGLLSKDEFVSFLHPEESVHMKDIVVYETIDDMDTDKDNKISLNEYIGNVI